MNRFKDDPRFCNKKVLVVNDCSKFRFFVSTALNYAGLNVVETKCGCEVFKKIEEERPDLVLIDKDIAEIDGLDTVRALLKENRKLEKAVLMTAFSYEFKKILKKDPLIEGNLLGRPFSTAELLSKVASVLEKNKK